MKYRRCGRSGILLPEISLGLWHNFSEAESYEKSRDIILAAYDRGITHFDLADNYGPPPGSAERTFGRVLREQLGAHRDQILVTTKAGHPMWDGVYGDWASRKHLMAGIDQSLGRLGLDYVDIFYSHRYDPSTPLEETMRTLDHIVRSGRALYAGLSKYPSDKLSEALRMLRELGTPALVNQLSYSMLNRDPERSQFDVNRRNGIGCVSFSPLAQGMLTDRYLDGIPEDSRAAKEHGFLQVYQVEENIDRVRALKEIADQRGEPLAQMALAWQLTDDRVTSVIVGVSSVRQLETNLGALDSAPFTAEQLETIDKITPKL